MAHALFIHGGALGDFLLALRLLPALRGAGTNGITVFARSSVLPLARWSGAEQTFDLDTCGLHALFGPSPRVPPPLQPIFARADLALNMLGENLSPALRAVGVARVVEVDPRPRPDWPAHITEQWRADLRAAGLGADAAPPSLIVPDVHRRDARSRLESCGLRSNRPLALLHPGAGALKKCWPLPSFLDLAERLKHGGAQIVFVLGPVERELLGSQDRARLAAAAPVLQDLSVESLAGAITHAGLVVANDSGVAHLAAALGVATLAIFGPTCPILWRPLGDRVSVVGSDAGWPSVAEALDAVQELGRFARPS